MKEELILPDNMNYRDPVSYMAARWFDEPFQADILSRALAERFHITTVDEDRLMHADFWYEEIDGIRTYVDAKLCTRNFKWTSAETQKTCYTDAVTIGERAVTSSAQCFSFVWRGSVWVVRHEDLTSIQPFYSRLSKGYNGHTQTLYHYSVDSLRSLMNTKEYKIDTYIFNIYDEFYACYERARNIVMDVPWPKTASEKVYVDNIRKRTMTQFRDELVPIVKKYNIEMQEVPDTSTAFSFELSNIMSGI